MPYSPIVIIGLGLTDGQTETLKHIRFNPATDRIETDRSLEAILNSFKLGKQWTISSGGEQVYFRASSTGLTQYPIF